MQSLYILTRSRQEEQFSRKNKGTFKVALRSCFGARGIGTNGACARVFKKNSYCDDVTKNKCF